MLKLPNKKFFIGEMALTESGSVKEALQKRIDEGLLSLIGDAEVSGFAFLQYLGDHGLGYGETECLVIARDRDVVIASDDRRARRVISELYGDDRKTGSLGLLRAAVLGRQLTPEEAFKSYRQMSANGAFLPKMSLSFFE